ncbi:MAG: ATP-binding protein [Gemmatimonadales bacterium]
MVPEAGITESHTHRVLHELGERVKELEALHAAARLMLNDRLTLQTLLDELAALLPPAFQYPTHVAAAIQYGALASATPDFEVSPGAMLVTFVGRDGTEGRIEVVHFRGPLHQHHAGFLAEEWNLVRSVVDMLVTTLNRRAAEQALRVSEERLQLAQTAAGLGLWELDLVTQAVHWSVGMSQMMGLTEATAPTHLDAVRAMIHPDDRSHLSLNVQRAIHDPLARDRFEYESRMTAPGGPEVWLASKGRIVRDGHGAASRLLGVSVDISGMRRLEGQFHQSQKMEAMGRLAGGVAHDFNNLLTAIKGYSEFVIDSLEPGDHRREDVEQISAAADRAAGLTRQLLAFSRHQALAPTVVDPAGIIGGMESLLRRLIGADVDFRVTLERAKSAIRVDAGQFEQVIMNLAVNARDAMPHGGVLSIETSIAEFDELISTPHSDLPAGRYVVMSVSDTGSGMTHDTKARLFEPFFTTKEQGRGTGLGLATVYGIVRQSGGAIWVFSEPGRGSTFKLYFPWVGEEAVPVRSQELAPHSLRGTEQIVLVDDDVQVRTLAERALRSHGYRVLALASAADAITVVDQHQVPVDLLITDIVMPRMQGPELASRIRVLRHEARVLFITGYAEERIELPDPTRASVLEKPFTPTTLLRRVRELLDQSRPSR